MKHYVFVFLIIVLILIFYKNIYSINKLENFESNTKVAICSMVTKQPDFEFWLKYHLDFLKIDYIFLRIEDSPEYKSLIEPYGDRVIASFHNKKDIDMKHNYLTIMDRQKENVNSACKKAKEMGIDFLFHCDADELIHVVSPGNTSIRQNLRRYLNQIKEQDENIGCIHFKNFEAVFPKMSDKCFTTNKFIDCKKGRCLSYANGKSCGLVQRDAKFRGPHYFTGKNYNMPDDKIVILHYDSCTYKQWHTKFDLLKDTDQDKMKKIPFPFYKNSIKKLQKCPGTDNKSCEDDLKKFFQRNKVDPFYNYGNKLKDYDAPNSQS